MFFSVVIPLYNKEKYILRAVESVLSQSFSDFELIVVDDGSSDGSANRLAHLDDIRIRIIRQENSGEGAARNVGISCGKGGWVAFLDADDYWCIDHLFELKKIINLYPASGMVSTSYCEQYGDGFKSCSSTLQGKIYSVNYFNQAAKKIGFINSSTVAIQKYIFDIIGGFGDYKLGADLELWARVALDYPVAVSTRITSVYVRNIGGVMEQSKNRTANKLEISLQSLNEISPSVSMLLKNINNPIYFRLKKSIIVYINSRLFNKVKAHLFDQDIKTARHYAKLFISPITPFILLLQLAIMLPVRFIILPLSFYKFIRYKLKVI